MNFKWQGLTQLQANKPGETLSWSVKASEANPDDWESWHLLSAVYGMLGQYSQSEQCCRRVISLQPGTVGAYINLGNVLKSQGRPEDAAASYREALKLTPNNAQAHGNLGGLYRDHCRNMPTTPMLEVQYEDLVDDQEPMNRRMIDFSGLDWNDACLRFQASEPSKSQAWLTLAVPAAMRAKGLPKIMPKPTSMRAADPSICYRSH